MKLYIKGKEVTYLGGCVIERNYPFFENEGIENTFSYSHKVPIDKITQQLFNYIERENTSVNSDLFDHLFIDNQGNQFKAVARINNIDDDHYSLNIEDTSSSIYKRLKDLNLNELVYDKYVFDTVDEYEAWAKGGSDNLYADRNLSYPLLNAKNFFSAYDVESATKNIWEKYPILNLWHVLQGEPEPIAETFLWPCIRTQHIVDAIASKLGLVDFLPSGLGQWYIPSNFFSDVTSLFLYRNTYVSEGGKIVVKIADFIPPVSALDFISQMLMESNSCVYGEMSASGTKKRSEMLTDVSSGVDITPYVFDKTQKIDKSYNGYKFDYYDDVIPVGGREYEESLNADPIGIKTYYKNGGFVEIGDVNIEYKQLRKFDNWFKSFGYLSLAKRRTTSGTTELAGYNTLYQYPFDLMRADMQTYLNWKVKAKRIIKAKCYPHRILLEALKKNDVIYNRKSYLLKQARWEVLPDRYGTISITMIER